MARTRSVTLLVAFCLVGSFACSKANPASPGAPTTSVTTPTQSATSATITGTVNGSGSSSVASVTEGTTSGLTISVTGGVSSPIDASGRFMLVGVPAGTVELHVTGPGVDVRIPIGAVAAGDVLEIHVTVTPAGGAVDNSDRRHDDEREIEGIVTAIPPITAGGQFVVNGITVATNSATTFKLNGHTGLFADIIVGARVHVKGNVSSTSATVTATEVNIQNQSDGPGNGNGNGNDDNDQGEAEVSGRVAGLTGACPAIAFSIGSVHVVTNASTRFELACVSTVNGTSVEVKGTRAANGTITATRVKRD